jgi:ubiquinone/menaquinone biosynthesis C-methylase UbiE
VINLSPDKGRVFREAFRILKPGGRLMVSDIVLMRDLPQALVDSIEAYVGCVAGAVRKDDYLRAIGEAGFREVRIVSESVFPVKDMLDHPAVREHFADVDRLEEKVEELASTIVSIKVSAVRPATVNG